MIKSHYDIIKYSIGVDKVRTIKSSEIEKAIEKIAVDANYYINKDILDSIKTSLKKEISENGKDVLKQLIKNAEIAEKEKMPICQDTGMAVVFLEIGQDVHIEGKTVNDAVNEGIRNGYKNGYLRKSIVKDPFDRINTGDNTPAIIHIDIVPGDKIKIDIAPKGFGSENMSALKMLKPSDGIEGARKFIIDTVIKAGSNPCPPVVVGIGIGGTMEKAALLSKKALIRPVNKSNTEVFYEKFEQELLEEINKTGIGPAGTGGRTTALGVNIEVFPTHIAGLPVAVNISCHATRHKSMII
jgi:fumarate hydratase subunit alpha